MSDLFDDGDWTPVWVTTKTRSGLLARPFRGGVVCWADGTPLTPEQLAEIPPINPTALTTWTNTRRTYGDRC